MQRSELCQKSAHFLLLVFKALTGIKRSALLFDPFASISAAFVILPTRVEAALLSSAICAISDSTANDAPIRR